MTFEEAESCSAPFGVIRRLVKPLRDTNRRDVRRIYWWRFGENAPKMRAALAPLDQFFAVGEVSKWAIFVPCEKGWLPGKKTRLSPATTSTSWTCCHLTFTVNGCMHRKAPSRAISPIPMTLYLKPFPSPRSSPQPKCSRSACDDYPQRLPQ